MATTLASLETKVRLRLNEATAKYWSSAELIGLLNDGIRDLWRSVNDLRAKHFCTLDITNVYQAASGTTLTGVPADLARVHLIEPRDLTSASSTRDLCYVPKDYNHPDFQSARALDALSPTDGGVIYYDIVAAGGPVAAPTIYVAPKVSSQVNLSVMYVPTLAVLTSGDTNPIPGESDNALIAWTVAFARAKEREDFAPDPGWLQIYGTEKKNLLITLTPRQTQELEVVEAMFADQW